MARFLDLPPEVLWIIADHVDAVADLWSWSRSCQVFYAVLTHLLYGKVKDDPSVMVWACDHDRVDIVQCLLNAGASAHATRVQQKPRWWLEALEDDLPCRPFRVAQFEDNRALDSWLFSRTGIEDQIPRYFHEHEYSYHLHSLEFDDDTTVASGEEDADFYYTDRRGLWPEGDDLCHWTTLHIAAASGNDALVTLLLDNGADIQAPSRLFCKCATPPAFDQRPLWTALHTAICHRHESTTWLLLSRGASIHVIREPPDFFYSREWPFTALHSACAVGFLGAARLLLEGGYETDVDPVDHEYLTPLAHAFIRGHWDIVEFLVGRGANVDTRIGPFTALGFACLFGFFAEAIGLLDMGATVQRVLTVTPHEQDFCLEFSAVAGAPERGCRRSSKQQGSRIELLNRLATYGVDVNQRAPTKTRHDYNGPTPLLEASRYHRVDVVEALLRLGADVRCRGPSSSIPSTCALVVAVNQDIPGYSTRHEPKPSPKGSMLGTCRVLLEAMAQAQPPPPPSDSEAFLWFMPGERYAFGDRVNLEDVAILVALRRACARRSRHDDLVDVENLLAMQLAKKGRPPVLILALKRENFGVADALLRNGFDRPKNKDIASLIQHFVRVDSADGLSYLLDRFYSVANKIVNHRVLSTAVRWQSDCCAKLLFDEGARLTTAS